MKGEESREKVIEWIEDTLHDHEDLAIARISTDVLRKTVEVLKEQPKCDDCGYAYVEGFVHEHLICEKHPEFEISEDWFCADFWKE